MAQTVKRLSTMWETRVRSLGWGDPLENEMAIHSSILAWRVSMDRGAWWAIVPIPWTHKELDTTEWFFGNCYFINNIKKNEHWRTDAFKLWCWRRLLRVPWTLRRAKKSVLKEMNAVAEAPILWPPDVKSQLTGKDPDNGKDWRQKEKRVAEDEMVR